MAANTDRYEEYYAEKLWSMLPAVYRQEDSPDIDARGPLREMVGRIGAQAAVLRRSIDRLWEDQSIETCDDWVIAYIGDLLATNLAPSLDARGQRLDVAKTIHYRRRKGTLAVLEEIAADITGWDVRVVEFFRRMTRTRHNLDPAFGWPSASTDPIGAAALLRAQGLVGQRTGTPAGGTADVRNAPGARRAHTAFDEFSHLADVRRGRGQTGWHDIPHLGVFVWRLLSLPMGLTTPVPVEGCPGRFTFDPTGRDIPLFVADERTYGDAWVSPADWQVPGPISRWLLQDEKANLCARYDAASGGVLAPGSVGIWLKSGISYEPVGPERISADPRDGSAEYRIDPERGRFAAVAAPVPDAPLVTYHVGFASTIGAGPYDRRRVGQPAEASPGVVRKVAGGGDGLRTALTGLPAEATVEIGDFLTYGSARDVTGIRDVCVRAANRYRPLVRLPATPMVDVASVASDTPADGTVRADPVRPIPVPRPRPIQPSQWVFRADASGEARLALTGLFVSGGDIVLRGPFAEVSISCCTFDPGTLDSVTGNVALAADRRSLAPCRLWVEGQVERLVVDRSIVGPIRTRRGGKVTELDAADTVLQAVVAGGALDLSDTLASLTRCTVLGPAAVHRLEASECILDDDVLVEDVQHGCVRFTAHTVSSVLPRQYESVVIARKAPLFVSRAFGDPAYAQLLQSAGAAILAGAENGSEMGAFSRELGAIKERALLIKYEEYMPLGLAPAIVYVT